ncbi:hypothetical protein [Nocardioides sp. AX2bis]|uniref:hypothetical protein n=1 Tax=Nocardioides sp. AX2bis TaxID=2653157 RepID=UPI0012EF3138|nr:hypothetical protein [Nocardioides sp. AX2bis]VXC08993.1 conserved hypothetical protein [Nocardioides sp. AX2bis]
MSSTTTTGWTLDDLLAGHDLGAMLRRDVDPAATTVETHPYDFGSPATSALLRVGGRDRDGTAWSVFVKVLAHLRHWPGLPFMPPETVDDFVAMFPWREELGLWRPALLDRLPDGLRVPHLHALVDLGDDRVAVWAEEVAVLPGTEGGRGGWDLDRFARAADLLGGLNARMCDRELLDECEYDEDYALLMWVRHALVPTGLQPLEDDDAWSHPALAPHQDLRARLRSAAAGIEAVLARLAGWRHGMPHGDASPQNLLVPPADDPADLVAIDPGFQTPAPLGSDLAQLVVGLVHAGHLDPAALPAVEDVVLAAYARGAAVALAEPDRDLGHDPRPDDVAGAYAATLLLRSGFTAIDYSWLADPDPARAAARLAPRVGLASFALDAAERHL